MFVIVIKYAISIIVGFILWLEGFRGRLICRVRRICYGMLLGSLSGILRIRFCFWSDRTLFQGIVSISFRCRGRLNIVLSFVLLFF